MHVKNLVLVSGVGLAAAQSPTTTTDTAPVVPSSTETVSVPPSPISFVFPSVVTSASTFTPIGTITTIATVTNSPCQQLYSQFFKHPELSVPDILGFYQGESTKKYFSTRIVTVTTKSSNDITDEDLLEGCSRRIGDRTLTDLPDDVQTIYTSFTSQWSSFVATAKTEASSIASVCLSARQTFYGAHLLDAVATEVAECVSIRKLELGTSTSSDIGTRGSFTTHPPSPSGPTPSASSTSSSSSSAVTGGAARETGYAVAAVVAVAGVVGLL
ncbi:hypothetical protein QBC38DRAFT_285842 [Podospora fimiseda]|uniref:Infection structure specific protein n=1 Tax=Podospora fimiseda TaxID=252190 RepID=A0AAN7BK83_9PEZI|nr:hypothetical protein QBC38DRAFT_285842 [Podospora fimiseda]